VPRSAIDDGTLFLAEGPKNIVNSVAAIFDELDDGIAATEYIFLYIFQCHMVPVDNRVGMRGQSAAKA